MLAMNAMIQRIGRIRMYLAKNRKYSELRGFDAGVRMFSDPPNENLRVAIEATKRIKKKISQWKSEQQNAMSKFGRKPTFDEAYQRAVAGDEDFVNALKRAYPELHHDVMQKLYMETPYGVPPPYARLYSDNKGKESFWKRHKHKILAGAALAAAAGLGYGVSSMVGGMRNSAASGQGSALNGNDAQTAKASPAQQAGSPKSDGNRQQTPAEDTPKQEAPAGSKVVEIFTKEEGDRIFKPLEGIEGPDFTPYVGAITEAYGKLCDALETKHIRPEDVKANENLLEASAKLLQVLQTQLMQKGADKGEIKKVVDLLGRLVGIKLKVAPAAK